MQAVPLLLLHHQLASGRVEIAAYVFSGCRQKCLPPYVLGCMHPTVISAGRSKQRCMPDGAGWANRSAMKTCILQRGGRLFCRTMKVCSAASISSCDCGYLMSDFAMQHRQVVFVRCERQVLDTVVYCRLCVSRRFTELLHCSSLNETLDCRCYMSVPTTTSAPGATSAHEARTSVGDGEKGTTARTCSKYF